MGAFYLDENLAESLTDAARPYGHDAVSTTQLSNKGAGDPRQPTTATDLGRILVTHNEADFTMPHVAWTDWAARWGVANAARHAGILIVPQALTLSVPEMAAAIDRLVRQLDSIENRLFVLQRSGEWNELV